MKKRITFLFIIFTLYLWSDVSNSSLNMSGYLNMTYDNKRENRFLFNDVSLIFLGNSGYFNVLGEIKLSDISLNKKSNNRRDVDIYIERLQLSYRISDTQIVQVGKFNSDIGYWNKIALLLLQDTISTPYLINNIFPKSTTGILFRQDINEDNYFSFTFQQNNNLNYKSIAYYGRKDNLYWHFSGGKYGGKSIKNNDYIGTALKYDGENILIQSELFFKNLNNSYNYHGGYLQFTWHFVESHDLVCRLESYSDGWKPRNEDNLDVMNTTGDVIFLFGYAYRPTTNIVIKSEYFYSSSSSMQFAHSPSLDKFIYSISVLF